MFTGEAVSVYVLQKEQVSQLRSVTNNMYTGEAVSMSFKRNKYHS